MPVLTARRRLALLALSVALTGSLARATESPAGLTPLFNGKDFAG